MTSKQLAKRILKSNYPKDHEIFKTKIPQTFEFCIELLAEAWAKEVDKNKWNLDLTCKAIDVTLYKIGRRK